MRKSEKKEREKQGERQGGGERRWNKKTVEKKGVASISGESVEEERARYLFLFRG